MINIAKRTALQSILFLVLAVALAVQVSAITITASDDVRFAMREGGTHEVVLSVDNLTGSVRRVTYMDLSFVNVFWNEDSDLVVRFTPGYDAGGPSWAGYIMYLTAYDNMGTPDDFSDDERTKVKFYVVVTDEDDAPASNPDLFLGASDSLILREGEPFETTVQFSNLVGSLRDSRYSILSSGDVQPSFVSPSGDEETLLHFAPGFDAAALSPYELKIEATDNMGTPRDTADDQTTTWLVPFEVIDAPRPSSTLEIEVDSEGPLSIPAGEYADVAFSFNESIGNNYGYSVSPRTSSFDELDMEVVSNSSESDVVLRLKPEFDAEGSYELKFNAMDRYGNVQTIVLPVNVTAPIGSGIRLDPPLVMIVPGYYGAEIDVTPYAFVGSVREIRFEENPFTIEEAVTSDGVSLLLFTVDENPSGGVPYYSPGSDDAFGSFHEIDITIVDDMGTVGESDDMEYTETLTIIVRPHFLGQVRLDGVGHPYIYPPNPIYISAGTSNELRVIFDYLAVGGSSSAYENFHIKDIYTHQLPFMSIRKQAVKKDTHFHITPGYTATAMSPYELVLVGIDEDESTVPDDDKIISWVIPVVVTESDIPTSNLSITAIPDSVTLREGELMDISFEFNDAFGSVRGFGYHVPSSTEAFNTFDIGVVAENDDGVTLRLSPELGAAFSDPYDMVVRTVDDMGTPFDLSDDQETSLVVPVTITPAPAEPSDISLRSAELNPDRLSCNEGKNGATVTVDLELENTASAGVDDARILIRNSNLGVDITERDIAIDGGERESLRYSFSVPVGTAPGDYEIDVKAYLGNDVAATDDLRLSVSACSSGSSGRTVSVSRDSGSSASSFTPTAQPQATSTSNRARSSPTTQTSSPSAIPTEDGEERSDEQSISVNVAPDDQPESSGFFDFITGRTIASGPGLSIVHEPSILVPLIVITGILWVAVIILAGVVTVRMR